LAAQALLKSMAHVDFGRVILFTHDWTPARVLPGIEIVDIEPLTSGADYSRFVLRFLPTYIRSSHALIAQWDGFVINPHAWTDEFLVHDYVGAVWPDQPHDCSVGNGGFSLRSRRFLHAGRDPRIVQEHPEDQVMCRTYRQFLEREHGVSFAPPALAQRFAFENGPASASFGFHGPYNLPHVLDEPTLLQWLAHLPDPFFAGRDARRLARSLILRRMPRAAQQVLARRKLAGRDDHNNLMLGAAASMQDWIGAGRS